MRPETKEDMRIFDFIDASFYSSLLPASCVLPDFGFSLTIAIAAVNHLGKSGEANLIMIFIVLYPPCMIGSRLKWIMLYLKFAYVGGRKSPELYSVKAWHYAQLLSSQVTRISYHHKHRSANSKCGIDSGPILRGGAIVITHLCP
ncbi:hypothetical protein RRG08_052405 [Elysia crispata]|uniref:Uncharacterized protein n=1 Tax=Elysia crispata TaxID=231223 RepID=A0AAE1E8V5_9GAST|nr:hypothetical protein RRG08_052405 [Elysia crispata]